MSAHRRTGGNTSKTVYPPVSLRLLGGYNEIMKCTIIMFTVQDSWEGLNAFIGRSLDILGRMVVGMPK